MARTGGASGSASGSTSSSGGKAGTRADDAHPADEFGGPIGVVFVASLMLVVVVALFVYCDAGGCPAGGVWWPPVVPASVTLRGWLTWQAHAVVLLWIGWLAVLYMVVPVAHTARGVPLADGSRLSYPINSFRSCMITIAGLVAAEVAGVWRLTWVADNVGQLAVAACTISVTLSVLLYASARLNPVGLAPLGNTGHVTYDFFMGHQLNPRIGSFDLKYFCELRPGLLGWAVINAAMMLKQYELHGSVSNSMVMVNLMQALYVLDAQWFEHCIVTSMDITTDGFGFMLAFGDLAWVPFTYTMQARYLTYTPVHLSAPAVAGILATLFVGFYVFRSANWQKDAFRKDPSADAVKHLTFLKTERGTKLLTSGWWGVSRHCNYLGDWIMSVAMCLPCGFATPIPYFYCIYFAALLVNRERRDDAKCRRKYGKDWEKYCDIVRWRIVPYVY